jgi:hypothetical protein
MNLTEYVEEVAERFKDHWTIFKDGEVQTPLPPRCLRRCPKPVDSTNRLGASRLVQRVPVSTAGWALPWLMLNTRPDLAHAVTFCARWNQRPIYGACFVLCHLMSYVVLTNGRGLQYAKPELLDLHAIADAALGADPIKR